MNSISLPIVSAVTYSPYITILSHTRITRPPHSAIFVIGVQWRGREYDERVKLPSERRRSTFIIRTFARRKELGQQMMSRGRHTRHLPLLHHRQKARVTEDSMIK